MDSKDKERAREEDRKRAKALWVSTLISIGLTKEEAELDFEKNNPLPKRQKLLTYQCGNCGGSVDKGNLCPKCGAPVQSYM